MTEIGRAEYKRGMKIIAGMALTLPYYLIHSYYDFDMSWEMHVFSGCIAVLITAVLVGLIEITFQVKEVRRELFEIKDRLDANDH
mgnify:CR=1 FL=1